MLHSIMTVNSSLDSCTSTQKPPVAYINEEINPNSDKPPLNFSEESINHGFTSVSKDVTSSDPEIKQDYSSPTPNSVPFDEVNLHMGCDQHTCYSTMTGTDADIPYCYQETEGKIFTPRQFARMVKKVIESFQTDNNPTVGEDCVIGVENNVAKTTSHEMGSRIRLAVDDISKLENEEKSTSREVESYMGWTVDDIPEPTNEDEEIFFKVMEILYRWFV